MGSGMGAPFSKCGCSRGTGPLPCCLSLRGQSGFLEIRGLSHFEKHHPRWGEMFQMTLWFSSFHCFWEGNPFGGSVSSSCSSSDFGGQPEAGSPALRGQKPLACFTRVSLRENELTREQAHTAGTWYLRNHCHGVRVQIKGFVKSVKNISEQETETGFIGSKNSGCSAAVLGLSENLLSGVRQGILFLRLRGHLSCLRRGSKHFQIGMDF